MTYEERKQHHDLVGFIPAVTDEFLKARRARYAQQPPDRVTVVPRSGGDHLDVMLDGKPQYSFEMHERKDAEIYAAGLRAELAQGKEPK